MRYCSTRGGSHGLPFVDSLLTGLAPDGGLLVPETLPDVSGQLDEWRGLNFVELAQMVVGLFVDDIPEPELKGLIADAYATFDHPDVVAIQSLGGVELLELFHGPTLAFKDVALQLLGRLFEYVLSAEGRHLNILGATSGDTGSAAIAGVRGQANIDIFILYPNGKVSALQELQMTTVPDSNVHCVAVDGDFDTCQRLMKEAFADLDYKREMQLGAVNSVNWARVLAQVVYYGYASLRHNEPVNFCVPTGNFGNVFAGYVARAIGFPINTLMVATNENDILARFFATGDYARGDVHFTLSPAMDIQVASNFERFLYYWYEQDTAKVVDFMTAFQTQGKASIGVPPANAGFLATSVSTDETLAAVRATYDAYEYVLDPHTAVGYAAAQKLQGSVEGPVVCIATAHPAKFPEAVARALPTVVPTHPALEALRGLPERKVNLNADLDAIKDYIRETVGP